MHPFECLTGEPMKEEEANDGTHTTPDNAHTKTMKEMEDWAECLHLQSRFRSDVPSN